MGLYTVAVDVATCRPPRADVTLYYRLEAATGLDAELTALQWAASRHGVIMPVASLILDWDESA